MLGYSSGNHSGSGDAAVPAYTWAAKSTAAGVCGLATTYIIATTKTNDGALAHRTARLWMAVFFVGGALSATIGAILEASYNNLEHGAGWTMMLLGVELAAVGAFNTGGIFHATVSSGGNVASLDRAVVRNYIQVGCFLFFVTVCLVLSMPGKGSFDRAMEMAAFGAVGLLVGCIYCVHKCPAGVARNAAGLWLAGTLVTAAGYVVSSAWLSPACPTPNNTNTAAWIRSNTGGNGTSGHCPLPAWLTPDGVYHSSMAIAYSIMACGTVVFLKPREGGAVGSSTSTTPLLSIQDGASAGAGAGAGTSAGIVRSGGSPAQEGCFEGCMQLLNRGTWYLMTGLPPKCGDGAGGLRVKHAINAHKLCCPLFVIGVMCWYQTRALHAYIYLAMHGVYGLTWLLKDATFPDSAWEHPATPSSFVALFLLMALFWIAPYLVVTTNAPAPEWTGAGLAVFLLGFFLLHTADAQKYYTMRLKKGLIDSGLFALTRNPNYLGEMLIYTGFALCAAESEYWWLPFSVNALVWSVLFVPRWYSKDKRLSRHPGFESYAERSGLVFPWIFGGGWW